MAPLEGLVAHGGAGGLAVELFPLVAILAVGLVVWWRSKRAQTEPGAGDETGVE